MDTEPISQDEVIQILRFLEQSDFDELVLEMGDWKIMARKGSPITGPTQDLHDKGFEFPESATPSEESTTVEHESKITEVASQKGIQSGKPLAPSAEEEGIPIKAPMLGTFYRAPKPGAPPFVEVGQYITEDDTVALIEVMKCFNSVKSGVRGRIKKVCVEDSQMVEYRQTLFIVEEALENEDHDQVSSK